MTDRISKLGELSRLLDEGRITSEEYERLKAELLASEGSRTQGLQVTVSRELEGKPPEEPALPSGRSTSEMVSSYLPTIYPVCLGLGVVSVFFGGTFGLLAWSTAAVSAGALYSERTQAKRWMAWTGLGLGILFSFMNAYLNGHLDALLASVPETAIAETGLSGFATLSVDSSRSPNSACRR